MARSEVASFIERTRRQLDSGHRLEFNALSEIIDGAQTTITLQVEPSTDLRFGDILACELEIMRVLTWNGVSRQATVRRGYLDSDAVGHAGGTEVVVNPRFTTFDVFEAMVDEINSWGPALHYVDAQEFSIEAGDATLELPAAWADALAVLDVRRRWNDPYADATGWPRMDVRVLRTPVGDWPTGASTSGLLLRFIEPTAAGTVLVTTARPFNASAMTITSDLTTDLKIPSSLFDVLSMGVKLRLTQDAEWARHARDQQDDSRRSQETPVGSAVQPLNFGYATYLRRKQEEIHKLWAQYPQRVS